MSSPAAPLLHDDHPPTAELFGSGPTRASCRRAGRGSTRLAPDPPTGRPLLPRLDESAARHSTTRTASCRRPSRRTRRRSGPRNGCATTITSSRIRCARSARTCRASYYLELAEARRRPVRGISARLRPRARADRAHGGAHRSRNHRRLRRRLSAHVAALDRRDLGDPDHAAARARRGAARGSPTASSLRGEAASRRGVARELRQRRDWTRVIDRRAARRRPADDGRLSAAFVVELLQWLRDQPSAAAPAWQALQRALEDAGRLGRRDAAARASARGRRAAGDRQRDHEHAAAVVDRLDAVLRTRQSRRADPARRSGWRVRARWTSRRAIAIAIRSSSWRARAKAAGTGRSPRCAIELAAAAQHDDAGPAIARHHVGYYLISRGRFRLERDVGYRADAARAVRAVRLPAPGDRLSRH